MSGLEQWAIESACKMLCSKGAHDFFFKWKLDESLLDRLKDKVKTMKDLLKVAGMRQIQENSIGDEWFTKARFAICDAEDVLDKIFTDIQKEEYRMGDSSGTCLIVKEKLRYKGKDIVRSVHPFKKTREAEMRKLIEKLESVASEVSHLGLASTTELAAIREARGRPTSSVNDTIKVCGRSEDKKNIMKLLGSTGGVDDALRVIPIVGLGGVGKTTLANMIFHECRSLSQTFYTPSLIPHETQMDEDPSLLPPEFDLKAWVCSSDEFQVVDVIKSVIEFINGEKPALDGLDSVQRKLKELLQGKKFLIILDDNWSTDRKKWDDLRTPFLFGQSGSRIIVTTRSKEVAEIVSSVQGFFYQLDIMSKDESWSFLPIMRISYNQLYFHNKILSDMVSNFKLLRVLSLEGYSVSVLPDSMGDMKLLRYMNIAWTDIECLPLRICRLYNLQFLILRKCYRLRRLPANIVELVNLRYLDVHGTSLEEMPNGIGTMKKLQLLSYHVVGKDKSEQMKELKDLTSLHGKLQISGLNNITDKEHVVAAQFGKKEYLEELVLNWEQIEGRDTTLDERVLDAIPAHENLKKLTVGGFFGKMLSTWIVGMTHSSNIMLRSLCISNCSNLETLLPLGNLPALVKLTITGSHRIQSLGEEFYGGSSMPFPALERFEIRGMDALKTWSFPRRNRRGFPLSRNSKFRIVRS